MKVTSDKEFDDLFKSSFEDFEMEPSANSWDKITKELENKPAKKFPIFWSAAASVVIVLGFGIGLYNKPTDLIKLRPKSSDEYLANNPKDLKNNIQNVKVDAVKTEIDEQPLNKEVKNQVSNETGLRIKESRIVKSTALIASQQNNVEEKNISSDATFVAREIVLDVTNLDEDLARVKPVKKIQSVAQQMLEDEALNSRINNSTPTRLALAQNNTYDRNLTDAGANTGRIPKIKSVGDLVNFVIAKVDKREEKIIKVSKTDEGDNEITGINLGLFKFSKSEK
jgi:hypothetical protein